jgi:hypothetical protein
MPNKMERFTQRARQTLQSAEEMARMLKHQNIGTHHLFLAILKNRSSIAARVLAEMDFEYRSVLNWVEDHVPPEDTFYPDAVGLTDDLKRVLELSVEEARRLRHEYIDTGHFLLAISRAPGSVVSEIFQYFVQDLQGSRHRMIQIFELVTEQGRETTLIDTAEWLSLYKGFRDEPYIASIPWIGIIPLDEDGNALLSVELAAVDNAPVLILTGGVIDDDKDPAGNASRNIQRRVGYNAARLDFLAKLDVQRKYAVWQIHAYLARDLTPVDVQGDKPVITIERVALNDFEPLIQSGRLTDSTTIACLYLARQYLTTEG